MDLTDKQAPSGNAHKPLWEPMTMTLVGNLADIMQGSSGSAGDGPGSKKP